jgi:predicted methyltransferase
LTHPTANLEINIYNTTNRINDVKGWLFIQRDCIAKFHFPLEPLFDEFKKYGHTIKYPCTNDEMLTQLQTIENKEKEHNMLLKSYKTRLERLSIAENKEHEQEDSRPHFINLINQSGRSSRHCY